VSSLPTVYTDLLPLAASPRDGRFMIKRNDVGTDTGAMAMRPEVDL